MKTFYTDIGLGSQHGRLGFAAKYPNNANYMDGFNQEYKMQLSYFTNGGFVIHKLPYGSGKISVWFDQNGAVLDIEKFDKNGRKTGAGLNGAITRAKSIGVYLLKVGILPNKGQ
jgi:hypothetical protein